MTKPPSSAGPRLRSLTTAIGILGCLRQVAVNTDQPGREATANPTPPVQRTDPIIVARRLVGVTTRCARRSRRDPTGANPVRIRLSEPPGNECLRASRRRGEAMT